MYNHMVFDVLHKQYRPVIYTIIFFLKESYTFGCIDKRELENNQHFVDFNRTRILTQVYK